MAMTDLSSQLSLARTQRRAEWEASQTINPTDLIGTCPDMCPEYERHEREAHFDVSPFEAVCPPNSNSPSLTIE